MHYLDIIYIELEFFLLTVLTLYGLLVFPWLRILTHLRYVAVVKLLAYADYKPLLSRLARFALRQRQFKWVRDRQNELTYLDLVSKVMTEGEWKNNRTGIKTVSMSGLSAKYDLTNGTIPLITTRRVAFRLVAEELLFFISGSTNTKILSAKNVKIWDANTSLDNLKYYGFEYPEGDMGPGYGFQWRHYGAEYVNCHAHYSSKGLDQLARVLDQLKNDPESRRIILSGWNPADIDKIVVPPCHMMCQFLVSGENLDCIMYQRSADLGLGVPFNIASYSLLTHMIAAVTGYKARTFTHMMGDAHVYENHIDQMRELVARVPYPSPTIHINSKQKSTLDDFSMADLKLEGYKCHPTIKMDMAV